MNFHSHSHFQTSVGSSSSDLKRKWWLTTSKSETQQENWINQNEVHQVYETVAEDVQPLLEKKKLMVYDSTGTNVTLKQLLPVPDTNTFVDPVTNQEVIKVIQHVLIYGNAPKYKLIENWSFDRVAGITRIKIEHIAPTIQKTDDNGNSQYPLEIFRLKFADISGMIEKYEQSHYNRSLANLLWNEYFITPAKPK